MLLNCGRCNKLTVDYVNKATGLEPHRFHWLEGDHEIGVIEGGWNHLVDVQVPLAPMLLLFWSLAGLGQQCKMRPLPRSVRQAS
ncbi:hypothetical protein PMIT1313_02160 [Prochlorococcus marinus str. MIT 1313]|nr:hypothetical protein PMIT1313_02160 [Prochlorococcus marinus str. MIT 1313]KZR71225.1 hypothetical protein PMIT1318_02368 [Prochlorococcus marinus str. MIT 1318]